MPNKTELNTIPKSEDSEMALLGSIVLDPNCLFDVVDTVTPEQFYNPQFKLIYTALVDMHFGGEAISIVSLNQTLKDRKVNITATQVAKLTTVVATASHAKQYAKTIREKYLRREILRASEENNSSARDEERDINSIIAEVQNNIFEINPINRKPVDIESILRDMQEIQNEYAEKYKQGKTLIGYSTGIEQLDKYTDGIRDGSFWTIGAWHGTGKTSFALNILHELMKQSVPTSFISLEMTAVDIAAKVIGIRHMMSSMKVIKGIHDQDEVDRINEGKTFLKSNDFCVYQEFDIEKIKMLIRKDVHARKSKVIVIDYLQKITSEKIYEETPLLSYSAKQLANLAQELNVTIICLSQISNEAQKGGGAGAGFKGSGTIEASSDLAIRLERNKAEEDPNKDVVDIKINVTKNKFGFDGIIKYYMHLPSGSFGPDVFNFCKV